MTGPIMLCTSLAGLNHLGRSAAVPDAKVLGQIRKQTVLCNKVLRTATPLFSRSGLNRPFEQARTQDRSWQRITMYMPSSQNPETVQFTIVNGREGRPDRSAQLMLARDTGEVIRWEPFAQNSAGRKLRIWFRFLHTGEAGGVAGQAIAAIASVGAAFLVYTGTALAIRRFFNWIRRRNSLDRSETEKLALTS